MTADSKVVFITLHKGLLFGVPMWAKGTEFPYLLDTLRSLPMRFVLCQAKPVKQPHERETSNLLIQSSCGGQLWSRSRNQRDVIQVSG